MRILSISMRSLFSLELITTDGKFKRHAHVITRVIPITKRTSVWNEGVSIKRLFNKRSLRLSVLVFWRVSEFWSVCQKLKQSSNQTHQNLFRNIWRKNFFKTIFQSNTNYTQVFDWKNVVHKCPPCAQACLSTEQNMEGRGWLHST